MLKKILIDGAATLGAAFVGAVVNEMRKEWDKMAADYNDLVDRYNENVEFIRKCDFYTYKHGGDSDTGVRFTTQTAETSDGHRYTVRRDTATGLGVISCERA